MKRLLALTTLAALGVAGCGGEDPLGPSGGTAAATVEVTPGSVTFGAVGSSVTLSAVVKDAGGNVLSGEPVTWSAAGSGVVTVGSSSGALVSVGNGSETVTATSGSAQGSTSVTVAQVPISLEPGAATNSFTMVGTQTTLQPFVADSNGSPLSGTASFTFASSDPASVHVTAGGTVTANGPGTADISVSSGAFQADVGFSVTIAGPQGSAVLGAPLACAGGMAAAFACDRMDMVAYLPLAGLGADPVAGILNDMWGWTDPSTGVEYALLARRDGVTFVDLSDPETPRAVGHLPSAAPPMPWRDVKVYQNHAYVVADASPGHGVQIFDLTRLRGVDVFTTFSEDGRYTGVSSVHNIAINEETGFAYAVGSGGGGTTCGGGLHMIDLSNVTSPTFAGCFADVTTGRSLTGYSHDVQCVVYAGPDPDHVGREICVGANETALSVADVTDKGSPFAISTATYPDVVYVHQGSFTEDHRYFVQNDELDMGPTRMLVWDMIDLDDPVLVDEHLGPTVATDHNMYVKGNLLYHSNYHFGIRILDVTDPASAVEMGFFDTHPPDDVWGFSGSWSNYPFFDSGIIAVASADEGLFILRLQ